MQQVIVWYVPLWQLCPRQFQVPLRGKLLFHHQTKYQEINMLSIRYFERHQQQHQNHPKTNQGKLHDVSLSDPVCLTAGSLL